MSRRLLPVVAILCGALAGLPARADTTEPARGLYRENPIVLAGQKHVSLLTVQGSAAGQQQGAKAPPPRSFVKRRPVLSGMLIGMAAGAAIVGATAGSEAAFVGFYGGAIAGAATGWVLSR